MKKAPTSPFSSPKCQLPEGNFVEENELKSRPRRKRNSHEGNEKEKSVNVRFACEELKQEADNGGSIRRTRTVPSTLGTALANEAERISFPERRQRRNLSRISQDELPEVDVLVDGEKRVSSSSRKNLKLKAVASERSLQTLTMKRSGGRTATPLDIPFFPTTSSLGRTMSAEPDLDAFLDDAIEANKEHIRRTRTQVPRTRSNKMYEPSTSSSAGPSTVQDHPLRREFSLPSQRQESLKHLQQLDVHDLSLSSEENTEFNCAAKDSAKDLKSARISYQKSSKGEKRIPLRRQDTALPDDRNSGDNNKKEVLRQSNEDLDSHVINVERSSRKVVLHKDKSSKRTLKNDEKNTGGGSTDEVKTEKESNSTVDILTWWQILLHYIGLLFVQYPFKYHKQWLDKMYKGHRLQPPDSYQHPPDWTLNSLTSTHGVGSLPSLPENSSSFRTPPKDARVRRRTQLDVDDPNDDFSVALEVNHSKRTSSLGGGPSSLLSPVNRPPPGHLPRSRHIVVERQARKKSRRSVEIFGDIMHALGLYPNGKGRLKLPNGISEMDESELSGFQARFYNFIKKHHKGRLARAWDHLIHPLDSMQKKHRRSINKSRLLNAIDKHRAQKYENNLDMVKTKLFLCGQWVFEALSPPKYTKKPMLLTVLFPLVLILFFGFMAGEYSFWREKQGDTISYKYGPEELSRWFLKSDPWRTFDDEFLIIWGARYLPRVTSESWRWLFSMLVHENFAHLGGNLLLFVLLSWSLESKYGFWRTALVCWLSGISGNFMSAAFEDSCGIVLGASGCVFGLAAFYIVDVTGDFKHVSFPCLRLIGISCFLCAFIIALTSHQEASHMSHIGGLLCGCCLSLVLVPRFIDERIEAVLPWIAFISALTLLCVLPLVVFCSILPNLECSS